MARIVLGVCASAAIHKSCELASRLSKDGHEVRTVLTPNAAKLIAPQLYEALTGQPAACSEWDERRRGAMDHIEWARFAQVLLVAPASADAIGRLAHGLADDFLSTIALALDPQKPRLLAPAMNPVMLAAPAVQRNLATLTADGWTIIAPGAGRMACGESGLGRLAEVDELVAAVSAVLPRA